MKYLIFNIRYMHEHGITQALRFSHTMEDIEKALIYVCKQSDWYDWRIITLEGDLNLWHIAR